jgi:hypothetical protein
MAKNPNQYRRKLSAEEAREGYIMIMKNALSLFPKVGKPFKLKVGEKSYEARVDAVECWCRGPDKPHYHYRIDTSSLRDVVPTHRGTTVVITKTGDEEYTLG